MRFTQKNECLIVILSCFASSIEFDWGQVQVLVVGMVTSSSFTTRVQKLTFWTSLFRLGLQTINMLALWPCSNVFPFFCLVIVGQFELPYTPRLDLMIIQSVTDTASFVVGSRSQSRRHYHHPTTVFALGIVFFISVCSFCFLFS